MTQKDANIMYDNENKRIDEHNQKIKLDLDVLSKIAGFKVCDYELSTCLTECHYGNKTAEIDGFISIKDYNEFEEKLQNIPSYRAKRIDSEEYVEGFYSNVEYFRDKHTIKSLINISGYYEDGTQKTNNWDYKIYEIDPSTLSIHFPKMLDSSNNKIFASLSKNGKGGDILFNSKHNAKFSVKFSFNGVELYECLDKEKDDKYYGDLQRTLLAYKKLEVMKIKD